MSHFKWLGGKEAKGVCLVVIAMTSVLSERVESATGINSYPFVRKNQDFTR